MCFSIHRCLTVAGLNVKKARQPVEDAYQTNAATNPFVAMAIQQWLAR